MNSLYIRRQQNELDARDDARTLAFLEWVAQLYFTFGNIKTIQLSLLKILKIIAFVPSHHSSTLFVIGQYRDDNSTFDDSTIETR